MMANIVILTLIAAYCIYLIYKGCKNMKEGCTGHTEKYKKKD